MEYTFVSTTYTNDEEEKKKKKRINDVCASWLKCIMTVSYNHRIEMHKKRRLCVMKKKNTENIKNEI